MKQTAQNLVRSECLRILDGRSSELVNLKNSEVVILGGTGFIGTWIMEMISALNDEFNFNVRGFIVSRSTDQFVLRYPHLGTRKEFKFEKCDVRQVWQLPMEADWLIHAAATPDTRVHASNPLETASVIVDGAMATVRAAERMSKLKMLLHLSSGLVVSQTDSSAESTVPEISNLAPPPEASFVYPGAKRFAETIFSAARSQCRIPTMSVRPFSLMGPYQPLDRPFAHTSFIADALRGAAIRVLGDGTSVRTYLYGGDAAYWILRMLTAGKNGEVYNLGSDHPFELKNMARMVADRFDTRPDIVFNTAIRSVTQDRQVPSLSKAQSTLGLSQFSNMEHSLDATIEWNKLQQVR